MSRDALERELTLLQACWAFFDAVRACVSAELQRGPRGGGRDRDHIVRHTFATEQDWAKKLGVRTPADALLTEEGVHAHRAAYCQAIQALHAQGTRARTWPPPVPDSAHRVSHARSRLGNGRQGSECQPRRAFHQQYIAVSAAMERRPPHSGVQQTAHGANTIVAML